MSDATKIHLAERPPVACAACYGQYTDREHVDFGATYDGPVLNVPDVLTKGAINVQIDELVICDECVRAAAALLGLARHEDLEGLLGDMHAKLTEQSERLRGALAYIETLETAATQREALVEASRPTRQRAKKA